MTEKNARLAELDALLNVEQAGDMMRTEEDISTIVTHNRETAMRR